MKPFSKCADIAATAPDARKHVNYIQGMVLGAPDLIQDFTYLQYKRQWLARDTIGYGTLSGLRVQVTTRKAEKGPEVIVSPGTALSPRGHLIRVVPDQCAELNAWLGLEKTKEDFKNAGVSLTGTTTFDAYLALCFNDCKVDPLPIPGEPCRCDDHAMEPSRIIDDFRLQLRPGPVQQREENASRDFVAWLSRVATTKVPGDAVGLGEFEGILHEAALAAANDQPEARGLPRAYLPALSGIGSPPESPLGVLASPLLTILLPEEGLCEFLRTAFRLWVTEFRPLWQAQWQEHVGGGCGCHGDERIDGKDPEECLLLAKLTITLTNGTIASETDVVIDDSQRPFVIHLEMLKELVMCGPCCGEGMPGILDSPLSPQGLAGDVVGPPESNQIQAIQGNPLDLTTGLVNGTALGFDNQRWHPVPIPSASNSLPGAETYGTPGAAGTAIEYARVDHVHPMPALPPVPLAATVNPSPETFGAVANVGVSVDYARADHVHALPALPPVPQPATTTPSPENFGAAGNIGASANYARADHVHPMPPLPAVPLAATVNPSPETFGAVADVGTSVAYARADHVHAMPALPPVPEPATTTPSAENFGVAGDIGTSANYARADHVHPMPPLPPLPLPATVNPSPETFGAVADVGTSVAYARADHVHALPVLPPLPQPATTTPSVEDFGVAGDVGTSANYARADHVHPMPELNPVEHPPGLPRFFIVAAGIVSGTVDPTTGAFVSDDSRNPVYNNLRVTDVSNGEFRINYKGYSPPNGQFQLIVKALSVIGDDKRIALVNFSRFGTDGIHLAVSRVGGNLSTAQDIASLEFMIEISRFQRV
jgi:hypothetical protein